MSPEPAGRDVVLAWEDLVLTAGSAPFSGALREAEILALAGLEGQGQELFLQGLAGLQPPAAGRIRIGSTGATAVASPIQAARAGIAYLPRDRRRTGIFPTLSVLDNFGLPSMRRFARLGILDRRRQRACLADYAAFLEIRMDDMAAPITALSGGNQQKVLLARWLALEPRVLLLDDPTRGVDLGTRLKFYDIFRRLAAETGVAMVILSTEIEEILEIGERVLVFRDVTVARELVRREMTIENVLAAMFGQKGNG